MKKKVLVSSILTIALCLSLIAGSTFALFTSESNADISIKSGKVEMIATIDDTSLELYSMDVAQTGTFENGGTAEFTDANTLVFENVTPGDKATFKVVMTNNSNVAVQYRFTWAVNGKLAEALVATADGETLVGGTSAWTEWAVPASEAEKTRTISVTIDLPKTVGNEYQEQTAEIDFGVIAVQGNGVADYVPMCDVLATPETIDGVLASVEEDTVIGLVAGKYGSLKMTQNNLTLVTNSAVVDFVDLNAKDGITLDGITFDAAGAKTTYSAKSGATAYTCSITGSGTADVKAVSADNVLIKNCTFTGTAADPANYAPIFFEEQGRATERASDITVTACNFDCVALNYVRLNYLATGTATITYNTFGSTASGTVHNAINATGNSSDWYIVGNTFTNWAADKAAFGSSRQGNGVYTITVKKNAFVNTANADEFNVLNLKTSYTADNLNLRYENNVGNFGLFDFASEPVADGNDNLYKMSNLTDMGLVVVNDASSFNGGKLEDAYIVLTEDVVAPLANSAIYGTPVAVKVEGGVFDGNGNSLDIENPQYNGYAIETYGGTIKNLVIDTAVGRGIVISSPTEDVYIDSVVIDGPGYAVNTTEHNGKKLYISNSTINGWTSLAGLDSVSFDNCKFGENSAKYWQNNGYGQDYDRLVRPYVSTVFTDCEFEEGFYVDLSALDAGCTVTLTNCTVNGVVLTAANYTSYITIELPSGRTLADCVVFG
ncbi:MAG: hypothetical protein IKA64_03125 [Clostridia bacterium]|nr:hypothetical protein [Clostridia bacterium]